MPLDGHAFLINQGWSGKGSGLRQGAISRPITIPQKRNLSGIGNDRDDAFPFWDHVFSVAASAIQIECFSSDDEDVDSKCTRPPPTLQLRQTSTGILSNRPPLLGTPASSGTTTPTPCSDLASSSTPRLSLLALSKRETARRALYSRFFRGPILGPDDDVQSDTAPSNDDVHKTGKKKRKIETEDLEKEERRRQKKLRKEAERAARKLNRPKEKDKMKRERTRPIEETTVLSASQQGLGPSVAPISDERQQRKRKKTKNKRITAVSIGNELDLESSAAISVDDQYFRKSDHGDLGRNSSRKRHNRDRSP